MTDKPVTTKKKMSVAEMIDAINRVLPWSSDAFNHDGNTLTGDELLAIQEYIRRTA